MAAQAFANRWVSDMQVAFKLPVRWIVDLRMYADKAEIVAFQLLSNYTQMSLAPLST